LFGKILRIDLSDKSFEVEQLEDDFIRKYLGGRGLGVKILYDEVTKDVHPFAPENVIVIASGILTGLPLPSSGRYEVVTKSPLTGAIATSNSGGSWGVELRKTGYDAIVIKGNATDATYLWIHDDKVEFKDAKKVWGKTVSETDDLIRKETDKDAKILEIGIAGENKNKIASIMNEKFRAAGRGGVGAVLGNKKLKAIAVKGTKKIKAKDKKELRKMYKVAKEKMEDCDVTKDEGGLHALGTPILMNVINNSGIYPTKNFQFGVFDKAEDISGEKISETILEEAKACFACPMACARYVKVPGQKIGDKEYPEIEFESLEYETSWAFGGECGVNNLHAIALANYLCNEYGLDTISTGVTIGFAMELFEKGIITEDDVGMDLSFGNADAMVQMVEQIARREGFGKTLADGSKEAAKLIGEDVEQYTMQVKGLELPAYDPRGAKGIGLNYATSNRGGAHVNGYTIAAEIVGAPLKVDPLDAGIDKVKLTITFQDLTAAVDSTGICLFTTFAVGAEEFAPMVAHAMGWENYTAEEFVKTGERIYALERLFNQREGFDNKQDTLSPRLINEEMPEGPVKGEKTPLASMLKMYYEERGYSKQGIPTDTTLKELDL
jgi:aldehyde:ferredoxin oxidoreductase